MSWRSTSGTSSTKRPSSKSKPSAMAWMYCGQSAIASTGNIWTRSLSHPSTPSAGSKKNGVNTLAYGHRDATPAGCYSSAEMDAYSLAVGQRHLACSTTRARHVWSPSVPAGTHQETTPGQWPAGDNPLVHQAGKGSEHRPPRRLSALWGQEGVQGLQRRAFVSVSWPWWHKRAFCQLAGSLLHSELRQQKATASPTPWTVHRRRVASPVHTCARRGVQPVSGWSAPWCLGPCGCPPDLAELGQSATRAQGQPEGALATASGSACKSEQGHRRPLPQSC